MIDVIKILYFLQDNASTPCALATIVGKEHSSYRSVGAKKIICRDGGGCGLLSGGCLEAAIDQEVRSRWHELPFMHAFSTMGEGDRLMGSQAGCAGVITVLFERLPPGLNAELYFPYGKHKKAAGVAVSLEHATLGQRQLVKQAPQSPAVFFEPWVVPITLIVLGCGPDAPAFAELARSMGWQALFFDHRPDYATREGYGDYAMEIIPLANIAARIAPGPHTAVMLMTHNYEADLYLLQQLHGKPLGYIGCLGPPQRYQQMKADLLTYHNLEIDAAWERNVHAPAGFFHGHAPEEIALAAIAQIQAALGRG